MAEMFADKLHPCIGSAGFSTKDITDLETRAAKLRDTHEFDDANHPYVEAATQLAHEARGHRDAVQATLDKEDAAKAASNAKPIEAAKPKFDNVPDLAAAVAKENGIPQVAADAYVQHHEEGRSHSKIADDFGVGKSTVGTMVRKMEPLMDAAKKDRLESGAKGEKTKGEAPKVEEAKPVEDAAPDQRAEGEAPHEDELAPAELSHTGDLVDEDNVGQGQDDGYSDGHINISDSPYGEGKVSADNNIDKARESTLKKGWDKHSAKLPEAERVDWHDLGSAQKDTYDFAHGSDNAARAHQEITDSANRGEKFNVQTAGAKTALRTDGNELTSELGKTMPPQMQRADGKADSEGRRAARDMAATIRSKFPSVATPVRGTYTLHGETPTQLHVTPLNSQLHAPTFAAIHELTTDPEHGAFFTHAMNQVKSLMAFTAPEGMTEAPPDAFYAWGSKLVAVNDAASMLDAAQRPNDRAAQAEHAATLAHELVHVVDDAAGKEAGLKWSMLSAHPQSRTYLGGEVDAHGNMKYTIGSVMKEALKTYDFLSNAPEDPRLRILGERISYPLDAIVAHMDMLDDEPASDRASLLAALHDMSGRDLWTEDSEHAATELNSVLVELRKGYPDLLRQHMPEGYAHAERILAVTNNVEARNAIVEDQHAISTQRGSSAQRTGTTPEPDSQVHSQVQRKPASVAERAPGLGEREAQDGNRDQRPDGVDSDPHSGGDGGLKPPPTLPQLAAPGGIQGFIKGIFADKIYRTFPSLLGALSTEQLADRFVEHPLVKKVSDAMNRMGGMANHIVGEANVVIKDWTKLAKDLGQDKSIAFSKLLRESTEKGMWPNKEFEHPDHDYLKPAAPDPLKASAAELAAYDAKIAPLALDHANLKAQWDKLPPAFQEMFPRVEKINRDNFDRHVAADRHALVQSYYPGLEDSTGPRAETIDKAALVEGRKARDKFLVDNAPNGSDVKLLNDFWDKLDSHKGDYDNRLKGPYFPATRFGDHIVSYKSPEFVKAEADLKAARDGVNTGSLRSQIDKLDEDISASQRRLGRATSPESIARHTADIADATAARAKLDAPLTAAKKLVTEREKTLNAYKADSTHYAVEFHENRQVAIQRVAQLEQFFGKDGTTVSRATKDQFFRQLDATTPAYVSRIADKLAGSRIPTDGAAIRAAVREMYLQNLPGSSALKSQLKRRNVPGIKDSEALRGFASKAIKDAYAISRKTHMGDMQEHISGLRNDKTNEDATLLGNELAQRMALNASMKTSKAISFATNATYFAQLGLSPGFMLMQGTQQWMNTAPMMAARHGVGVATSHLAKGTADAAKLLKVSFDSNKRNMTFGVDTQAGVHAGLISPHEAVMLKDFFDRGRIDIASAHDAGIAASGTENGILAKATAMSNWPVQQLEVINRISTALAGFRAELAKNVKEGADIDTARAKASAYADRLTSETHMNYTAENRARFIHPNSWGGWGRVMFQFRAYQQGMAYLTLKNVVDGMRGDKEAMKAAGYLAGTQLAAAGTAGMPIPGAMVALASQMYKTWTPDDEHKDLKEMFYQGIKSVGGESMADLVTGGIPAALGVNVSGKLGSGTIFDAAPFARPTNDGRDMTAAYFMSIAGGAAGGQVANGMEAIHQASQGNFAKAAMLLPGKVFTDLFKAEEYQRNGMKDSRGNTILHPDDVSMASSIIRGLGLQSQEVGRVQDERQAMFEARQNRNDARAKLLSEYAEARMAGEDTSSIHEAIAGFNERHPDDRIAGGALPLAVQKRREAERNLRNGVPVGKRDRALYQDVLGN